MRTKNVRCRGLDCATTPKRRLMKIIRSLTAPKGCPKICPFPIMFRISYPVMVRRAARERPKSQLLRYLLYINFPISGSFLAELSSLIAFRAAGFLSTVITRGGVGKAFKVLRLARAHSGENLEYSLRSINSSVQIFLLSFDQPRRFHLPATRD